MNLLEGRVEEPTPDGYLTGVELGDYLYRTVPKFSQGQHPQHGKIHDQQLNTGDFVFVLSQNRQDHRDDKNELDTMATLDITSIPSGAAIYIDGTWIGTTPIRSYQIDTGISLKKQVTVGLELSGHKSRVRQTMLKGGQPFLWDVVFEKISKQPLPPKPNVSQSEPVNDIQIDEKNATYLLLAVDNRNTLTPINNIKEWSGWTGGFLEKTRGEQLTEIPAYFVNDYIDRFDYWIYSHAESRIVYDLSGGSYSKIRWLFKLHLTHV